MSAPEPYSAEELVTLRTGSLYQTRANARWFATLAAAARARDAEVRELVKALRSMEDDGSINGEGRIVLAKYPEAR